MTQKEFDSLRHGDIVRHKIGDSYVITYNISNGFVGIRTIGITNPKEWDLIKLPPKKDHE